VALTAIPAFLTGEPSERHLKGMQGISSRWMSSHEDLALVALWISVGVGGLALAALIAFRKLHSLRRWVVGVFLLLGLVVCGFMVRTANYGGKIHHPEIRNYSTTETVSDAAE